ncbi:MAG: type II 3-dehydroquinate dehydratase [Leptotrichiaceae bacterium]|nr:type II 3-dehydroquinate dehydratase [Leptotrichiaceae bacterium]MBP6281318.1 type II 3-dehydroquinate dehydratase [Leptotrichiaceae bacterium]MBP7100485.1 type II 3-dehydroquinate dehydratase [Leptotrichiaceae bacterium]MBP7739680.1 type II 3-dehydroquinate dehydratase [Leptotrichiaceae bacterium]MBP9630099.1 type II 3-dehydroquinate dehydratase [Leptotrichiaceae bacterium]
MKKILVINGPNLNFLGIREKSVYGDENYNSLCEYIKNSFSSENIEIKIFQSNCEGEIIDELQKAYYNKVDGIVINPGAYTHYSYAIFDAIKSVSISTVEVHISNIHEREEFRRISVIAPACVKQIYGKGKEGYVEAIKYLIG